MMVVEIVLPVCAVVLVAVLAAVKAITIIPPTRARNVERLGRYRTTLQSGLHFVVPGLDRVKPEIDLRERPALFPDQRVITADDLFVRIDTVVFYQVTDARAAEYEIVDYPEAIGLLTATMLRNVIGSMDLQQTLKARNEINKKLRGALDSASGNWGIRVNRVDIKELDPAQGIMEDMEKKFRAGQERIATIARAEGDRRAAILRSEGNAAAIETVFKAIHEGRPDPELLAYYFVQQMPRMAQSQGSTVWMIPNELTTALRTLSSAFGNGHGDPGADRGPDASPLGPRPLPGVSDRKPAGDGGPAGGKPDNDAQPAAGGSGKAA